MNKQGKIETWVRENISPNYRRQQELLYKAREWDAEREGLIENDERMRQRLTELEIQIVKLKLELGGSTPPKKGQKREWYIPLICGNCDHQWDEVLPYGAEVKTTYARGIWVHPANCCGTPRCEGYSPTCTVCGRDDKAAKRIQ